MKNNQAWYSAEIIDVDDTLYDCNSYACRLATKKHGLSPPLDIEETTSWTPRGDRSDLVMKYYEMPEFVANQPIFEGARDFINDLMKIADVYIITAVPPHIMSVRMQRLMEDFPYFPKENIIMGFQKDLIQVDFLLDDSPINILKSSAFLL